MSGEDRWRGGVRSEENRGRGGVRRIEGEKE